MPEMFLPEHEDPRVDAPYVGDERSTLAGFLTFQRDTFRLKCAGLTPEQLARRAVEPSSMSLLGLIRHMADVELGWFRTVLSGDDAPQPFRTPDNRDEAFDGVIGDAAHLADAWAAWEKEVAYADQFTASAPDLSVTGVEKWRGPMSLRWVLVHMIEEYARHNGHADLLRERIDGAVGQ
ncbi:MAG: hypothetical protein QOG52_641 [Frankiaceae bacterium]|jgi:uncharacterized damage-inducible protein DinB|nr:hypothetical protein [Frankiaceae bacterium]